MTVEQKGGESPRRQVDEDKQAPEVATEEKRKSWFAHIWDAVGGGAVSEATGGPGRGTKSRDRTSN
jgi:hypothetical protein